MAPSPYWGAEPIWDSQTSNHNPMMDEKGRVWFTTRVRPPANPDFCKKGSEPSVGQGVPARQCQPASLHVRSGDGKFTLISTCFPTHHLIFAEDANQTLWTSAGGPTSGVVGWLNRKMFEETGDEVKSQGWTPFILDTNGNGKRDEYVEPDQPVDPTKDKRVVAALYSVAVNPVDGSVWGTSLGVPGYVVRVNPGSNPTQTATGGSLRAAIAGIRAARRRHRSQWRVLGVALERPSRQLRPAQVQGPAQRAERDRQALPRRLDAAIGCPDRSSRTCRTTAASSRATTRGSISSTRSGWAQNVPIATGNLNDSLLALVDGQVRQPARALPHRLLHQMGGRTHRRSEGRLEGQGAVDDLLHQNDVPPRRRQGEPAEGREVPAAPRSARAVKRSIEAPRNIFLALMAIL